MEDLTKHQLILLALLISFVTSLATGIVTVSLMSQAPQGVAQTINQVVERTIERVVSTDAAVGSVQNSSADRVAKASATVLQSTVKLRGRGQEKITGIGLLVSRKGAILTDKTALEGFSSYNAVYPDGHIVPVVIIQSQTNGNIVFLAPDQSASSTVSAVTPIATASSTTLGQDVFSLALTETSVPILGQGILTSATLSTESNLPLSTTIVSARVMPGSPLFNSRGEIIGIRLTSLPNEDGVSFYPVRALRSVIPTL